MKAIAACAAVLLVSGCQALKTTGDILSALAPTPQEQCQQSGGKWRYITTYDAQGNPTTTGECVSQ